MVPSEFLMISGFIEKLRIFKEGRENVMEKKKQKEYSLLKNMLYVYKGVAKHKPYLIALIVISAISAAGSRFVWLFLSKYVIEYIQASISSKELIQIVCLLTFLGILFMIGRTFVSYWTDPAAFYVRPMFMLDRNKRYFNMKYEWMEHKEVLDSLQKSIHATSWPQNGVEGLIRKTINLFSDLFVCLIAMVILIEHSPFMIVFVLAFGVFTYRSVDKASKMEKKLTKDEVTCQNRKKDHFVKVTRDFAYGKDIRLFRGKDKLLGTIDELNEEIHGKVCAARGQWIKSGLFVNTLEFLREAIMYAYLIYLIARGTLGIAEFTLYIGCVRNFATTFQTLVTVYAEMRQCSREVNDFRGFCEFCEEEGQGKERPDGQDHIIEFRNVSFRYPSSDQYALKNFSITIHAKTKLAVVGLNGAGKTTFVKLLLRLYDPTEGDIFMDGENIKNINRMQYYELFAPVFQDLECFAFTLAENVSMQNLQNTDMKRAELCLRKAGLENKLDEWEKGLETQMMKIMHNDGVNLSGGEMQKMGLARALYKDAPIVVLDEPTAALDPIAESNMYQHFDELVKGKIAIYISHRLASTRFCDVIAMFEDGKLIEYGTHDELMGKQGKYAKMFDMQAHYYKKEDRKEKLAYE